MAERTERLLARTAQLSKRRPPPPRELKFTQSTKLLTWKQPPDQKYHTHFRVRVDSDSGSPDFELSAGQQSVMIPTGWSHFLCVSTYNDQNQMESPRVYLKYQAVIAGASAIADAHLELPYQTRQDGQGHWFWGVDVSITGATAEPFRFKWTVRRVNAGGTVDPASGEVEYAAAFQGINVEHIDKSGVDTAIPLPTDSYPGFRFYGYAASLEAPETWTKQTTCWGGADHEDVFPASPTPPASTITGQERGSSRTLGTDTLTRFGIQVAITLSSAPVAGQWVHIELSMDNGTTWEYLSRQPITTTSQTYSDATNPGNPYSDFQRFCPQADSTCKVRYWTATGGAEIPPGAVVTSAAFTVNKVGNAPANALSTVTLSSIREDNKSGVQCFGYDVVLTADAAPNAYSFRWTIEHVDAGGNIDPVYGRVPGNEFLLANSGSKTDVSDVNWGFPAPGSAYPGLRYRAQALSRQLPLTWVDQTTCFGGAAYVDKFPASSGGKMIVWEFGTTKYYFDSAVGFKAVKDEGEISEGYCTILDAEITLYEPGATLTLAHTGLTCSNLAGQSVELDCLGLLVGGNRVVTTRQAAIASTSNTTSGTADLTYDAVERDLINALKSDSADHTTKINAILGALRTHGLIST